MNEERPAKIVLLCASSAAFIRHHLAFASVAARTMEVHAILTLDEPEDKKVVQRGGIIVHPVELSRKSVNPLRILHEALIVRGILSRVKPDIVNPINIKSVLTTAFARIGLPGRMIGTVTGLGYMFVGNTTKQKLLRSLTTLGLILSLPRNRCILVFSNKEDKQEFIARGITEEVYTRLVPIPGVNTREFTVSAEPARGYRVVLPARMLWDKGVGDFVRAAEELRGQIPGIEFILAGSTDPNNPADIGQDKLWHWQQAGLISWLGHCDDMPGLIASCHVVCLPSTYREGFPRVLAEAMACARPIITTDIPGCRDAVTGSGAGLLVPPGDPQALAEAILRLYRNPEERHRMGGNGRAWVEEVLHEDAITDKMLEVYQEFLRHLEPEKRNRF